MAAREDRVLVVGAGPTGLTAAVELARRGVQAEIIDRDEGPTPLSRAVGISAHSLDILEPSGVTLRLLERGIRIRRLHIRFEGQTLGSIGFSALRHRFNFLLSLPQNETETILAAVLAESGVTVRWRSSLVGVIQTDAHQVEATIDGPNGRRTARYDYVLGADGVHSAVREATRLHFDGYTHQRSWSIADVDVGDWPFEPGDAHLFLHRGGDVGFVIPIGERRFRAVSNTDDAMARVPGRYTVANLWRKDVFRIHARQASQYQIGRVFLGGDAAHVHSPVGARGMNLGIEDAAAFARRLVAGDLDGYTAERRPVGHRWIVVSERILRFAQSTGAIALLRNNALRVVGHVPALQRPILERVAGLSE